MNVLLIGYRGTGKSTVAQLLALQLGWPWIDADVEIELRAGKSIAAIFADAGEPAFRDLESRVVAELCRGDRQVLALGGGAVLRPDNRAAIRAAGRVFWLQAAAETLWERICADESTSARRPNLTASAGLAEVRQILHQRTSLYRECADREVDTEGKAPLEVANEICQWLSASPQATDRP